MKQETILFIKHIIFNCLSCGAFVCGLLASIYFYFSDKIVHDVAVNQTILFSEHVHTNSMYMKLFVSKSVTEKAAEKLRYAKKILHDDPSVRALEKKVDDNNKNIIKKVHLIFYILSGGLFMSGVIWYLYAIHFNLIELSVDILKNLGMTLIMACIEISFLFTSAKRFIPVNPVFIDSFLLPLVQSLYCSELTSYSTAPIGFPAASTGPTKLTGTPAASYGVPVTPIASSGVPVTPIASSGVPVTPSAPTVLPVTPTANPPLTPAANTPTAPTGLPAATNLMSKMQN